MKTAHIFNEIKGKKNTEFDYVPFNLDFFMEMSNKRNLKKLFFKDIKNPLYNKALMPTENPIIVKYDDEKIKSIIQNYDNEIFLVNGDFWGIQKFIFSDLSNKKAAKILRSRSAKVQIITKIIIKELEEMGGKEILYGAGKFMVVMPLDKVDEIKQLQQKLDEFFLQNYFGEAGVVISYEKVKTSELDKIGSDEIEKTLVKITEKNELNKLKKFNLANLDRNTLVFDVFNNVEKEDDICQLCKKRIAKNEYCEICSNEIKLGSELTKKDFINLNNEKGIFIINLFKKWYVEFSDVFKEGFYDISNRDIGNYEKWQLKSFVAMNKENIKTFEEIQNNSSGLMALKADVDRLGKTFKTFYYKSFKKFNRLSREVNFFFSNFLPYYIEQFYKEDIYVVFSGGDDLFLIGRYDSVVELAKEIRKMFVNFTDEKATISMGLVMFKHTTPIPYVSEMAEEAEKRAKKVIDNGIDRNGIDIFGISMKFDEFIEIENKFADIVNKLKESDTTSFYYKLIEIIKTADEVDNNPINAIWKSKLNYLAQRNMKMFDGLAELNFLIEKYGKKILPSVYLTIYKRRDNGV